jgi:hypothetical protein
MAGRSGRRGLRFGCVQAAQWPVAAPLLMPAIAWSGDARPEDVEAELNAGRAQLWIATDGVPHVAVVTRLRSTEAGLVCEIWLTGGRDRRAWLHFIAVIEAAARERGCIKIEIVGRRGWSRVLRDYRQTAVVLEKLL